MGTRAESSDAAIFWQGACPRRVTALAAQQPGRAIVRRRRVAIHQPGACFHGTQVFGRKARCADVIIGEPMRIGVIGTSWGLMHVAAFRAAGAHVAAIAGHDEQKTRAIAAREQIQIATTNLEALFRAVDAVVVASPDHLHSRHVIAALSAGKHVLCEKPLAGTLEQATELVRAARASGSLKTAVGFPYRQLPPLLALRRWLATQEPVHELDVVLRSSFIDRSGSLNSSDLGGASHPIDAALWLTGSMPLWAQAALEGHSLSLQVGLSNGARLSLSHRPTTEPGIHGAWALAGKEWEAGFFAGYQPNLGGWRISAPRAFAGHWYDIAPSLTPSAGALEPWAQAHVDAARIFLGAPGELASFTEGAMVQSVLDAAVLSHSTRRRVSVQPWE
jgi:myo-inositol 2-dehydrogenase / D-chiro-inositol 1-dehydrogenase